MADTGLFPDVADLLCDLLVPQFFPDAQHVGLMTPDNLADRLPFGRFGCIGGSPINRFTDESQVDVDVFAGSITAVKLLAEQIRQFLVNTPHTVNGVVLDGFRVSTRPFWAKDQTLPPGVFRAFASYRVSARRITV